MSNPQEQLSHQVAFTVLVCPACRGADIQVSRICSVMCACGVSGPTPQRRPGEDLVMAAVRAWNEMPRR